MLKTDVQVDFSGLLRFRQEIGANVTAGIQDAAEAIKDLASQLAPEDTGALKDSGEVRMQGKTAEISFGNGLPDGRAVGQEYGTYNSPAQPYLGPALKEIDVAEYIQRRMF